MSPIYSGQRRNIVVTPCGAVGLSWNVHEEDFFHSNVINRLAPRISYGLTGNFDRSGSSTPLLTVRRSFNSAIGAYLSRVSNAPNPKLRWERTKTLNIGVETELFNRLSIVLEYYDKRSYDLLGNVQIDPTLGFSGGYINAADMRNRGVEMQLNAEALRLKDFSWFVNFVFGYNKNKITNNNISDGNPLITAPMLLPNLLKVIRGKHCGVIVGLDWMKMVILRPMMRREIKLVLL